jgi:ribosome biogenesis GTPase
VHDGCSETAVEASGRLLHMAESAADLPAVGDWVLLRDGWIDRILPRRTMIARKAPGKGIAPQVLAANIDLIFVVTGLDGDLNLRRLERYLVAAAESGAEPVIVLNKADLCHNPEEAVAGVRAIAPTHSVLLMSAELDWGTKQIRDKLAGFRTGTLLGSSGAGKSTLLNRLLGEELQRINEVRLSDRRGQHTTTHRHLFRRPGGGLLIDQPGLREVQLWAGQEALAGAFEDLSALASECRFRDCRHQGEPGCAVASAVAAGDLSEGRLKSYEKLRREIERIDEEQDIAARLKRKRANKTMHKAMRNYTKWPE